MIFYYFAKKKIMALPSVYEKEVVDTIFNRLDKISPDLKPQWGKMDAAQMLAHINVGYRLTYDTSIPKATGFKKFMLKLFVKKAVTSEKPFAKNGRTAPNFIINSARDFNEEKSKFIENVNRVLNDGRAHFEGRESVSFGVMTSEEWNNQFYKHIDHHFTQFGV